MLALNDAEMGMVSPKVQEIGARVQVIVSRILAKRVPEIGVVSMTQTLSEAGLTSLDMVNLMLGVEEEFDIFVPVAQMVPDNFKSIAAMVGLIGSLLVQEVRFDAN